MRAVLYGSGRLLHKTYEYLQAAEGVENVGVVEDRPDPALCLAEALQGVPVFDLPRLGELMAAGAADAVILLCDNPWMSYAVRRLLAYGIGNICYLPFYYEQEGYRISDDSFLWIDPAMPRLEYLEYHLSWHCNLKCKGCTHFSNLIKDEIFGDFDAYCRDLLRMQELFWGIYKIRLMGGEPLLNPRLPEFVAVSRAAFPDADIRVVSNGLLLRESMEDLLDTMAANEVGFDVSMYPPSRNMAERMNEICRNKGVKLYVTPEVKEFRAGMAPEGNEDPRASYEACPARHCAFLGDGVISTCGLPQWITAFNEHFKTQLTPGTGDIIDLYEEGLDGAALLKRLRSPMEMCRYCKKEQRTFPWQVADVKTARAEDWYGKILNQG